MSASSKRYIPFLSPIDWIRAILLSRWASNSEMLTSEQLKCNAQDDYPLPCSRCGKLGLDCKIQLGFRRINKRQSVQSPSDRHYHWRIARMSKHLANENEQLRKQLSSQSSKEYAANHNPSLQGPHDKDDRSNASTPEAFRHEREILPTSSLPSTSTSYLALKNLQWSPPRSRNLCGFQIASQEIQDTFNLSAASSRG